MHYREISLKLYEKILLELKEVSYSGTILFSAFSEPLLNKLIYSMIEMTKKYLKSSKIEIVSNGDVITEINFRNLLDFHKKQNNEATIAVKKFEVENPYGVVRMSKEKVVDLIEKPISKSYVSAGIYVFNPSLFKKIKKNEHLDMTLFINRLLKNNVKISACPLHESWLDIGQHVDYKKANNFRR